MALGNASARDGAAEDPNVATLATYEATAATYRAEGMVLGPAVRAFLDRIAELVGPTEVLELGSGPGRDARHLEARGVRVRRTDGTRAFVELMCADGFDAELLDVRTDGFGGPYAGVVANAVLLHLSRPDFHHALRKARAAVVDGGLLAITLKDGAGESWTTARLGLPRHFTFWRAPEVRRALEAADWQVISLDHVDGRYDAWLHILARAC